MFAFLHTFLAEQFGKFKKGDLEPKVPEQFLSEIISPHFVGVSVGKFSYIMSVINHIGLEYPCKKRNKG